MTASPAGNWKCSIDTPMGEQEFDLTIEVDGMTFHGTATNGDDGKRVTGDVDGDTLTWEMTVSKPMPLTLDCKATVEADELTGKVKAGFLGSYPLVCRRV